MSKYSLGMITRIFSGAAFLIAVFTMLGYLLDQPWMYNWTKSVINNPMAVNTAICICFNALAILISTFKRE